MNYPNYNQTISHTLLTYLNHPDASPSDMNLIIVDVCCFLLLHLLPRYLGKWLGAIKLGLGLLCILERKFLGAIEYWNVIYAHYISQNLESRWFH